MVFPCKLVGGEERDGKGRYKENVVYCNEVATSREETNQANALRVYHHPIRHADRMLVWSEGGERGAVIGH